MAIGVAVSAQAAYTVWGTSLGLFLAVLVVVAALLTMILRAAGRIEAVAGQIWVANPDGSGARPVDPTVANNGSSGPWIRPAS